LDECVRTDTQPVVGHRLLPTGALPTGALVESALDDAQLRCPSQLHGAIHFIHQAFGTPRESENSAIPAAENRALWLDAEYTQGFKDRSPRTCIQSPTCPGNGCQQCMDGVPPGAVASDSTAAERYCLCILANVPDESVRQSIDTFVSICTSKSTSARSSDAANASRPLFEVTGRPVADVTGSFMCGWKQVSYHTPDNPSPSGPVTKSCQKIFRSCKQLLPRPPGSKARPTVKKASKERCTRMLTKCAQFLPKPPTQGRHGGSNVLE